MPEPFVYALPGKPPVGSKGVGSTRGPAPTSINRKGGTKPTSPPPKGGGKDTGGSGKGGTVGGGKKQ